MIKKYNRLSLLFGGLGFVLQACILIPGLQLIGLVGLILFIVGFVLYLKSIGQHPAWALFGLLGWVGIIVIMILKDKTLLSQEAVKPKKVSLVLIISLIVLLLIVVLGVLSAILT